MLNHQRFSMLKGVLLFTNLLLFNFAIANIEVINTFNASLGDCNGAVIINASGDVGPFRIEIYDEEENLVGEQNGVNSNQYFPNLCEGYYKVFVINNFGCTIELDFRIRGCGTISFETERGCPKIKKPTGCGSEDGSFRFFDCYPKGGTAPYTYEWPNGTQTLNVSGLAAGPHVLTVTDANGCEEQFTLVMPGNTQPEVNIDVEPACINSNNGYAGIGIIDLENQNYNFEWQDDPGANTYGAFYSERNDLPAGQYTVVISTPLNNCPPITEVITIPELPTADPINTLANIISSCPNENNGSIDLEISGGIPPFTTLWNNGRNTVDLVNVEPGSYSVTVTDYCDDSFISNYTVTENQFEVQIKSLNDCQANNQVEVEVDGGIPPYSFQWSNGLNIQNPAGLETADYTVTVTDSRGCQVIEESLIGGDSNGPTIEVLTINEPEAHLSDNVVVFENGFIEINVIGVSPISIVWSTGETGSRIDNLSPGQYSVLATDGTGCSSSFSFEILGCNNFTPLSASISPLNVNNPFGSFSNGILVVSISGGVVPYNITWTNSEGEVLGNESELSGIPFGWYNVSVIDACGTVVEDSHFLNNCDESSRTWWINHLDFGVEGDCTASPEIVLISPEDGNSYGNGTIIGNAESELFITWPDGRLTSFTKISLGGETYWQHDYGPLSFDATPGESYTVQITNNFGCSDFRSFTIHRDEVKIINPSMIGSYDQTFPNWEELQLVESFVIGCSSYWDCNSGDHILDLQGFFESIFQNGNNSDFEQERFSYLNTSDANPCQGGGELVCFDNEDSFGEIFFVPSNDQATLLINSETNACGCYFPAGIVQGITQPVFVEFECEPEIVDIPESDYECENGIITRTYIPGSNCKFQVICNIGSGPEVLGEEAGWDFCVRENIEDGETTYDLMRYCKFDEFGNLTNSPDVYNVQSENIDNDLPAYAEYDQCNLVFAYRVLEQTPQVDEELDSENSLSSYKPNEAIEEFQVFPNPFNNTLIIEAPSIIDEDQYTFLFYNYLGQVVKQIFTMSADLVGGKFEIDMSDIPVGMYQIGIINSKSHIYSQKIVKVSTR